MHNVSTEMLGTFRNRLHEATWALRVLSTEMAMVGLIIEDMTSILNSIEGIDTPSAPTTCTCEEECICD